GSEEDCKVHCVKEWMAGKACAERQKSYTIGRAHCSGQKFDVFKCLDHCAAP
uniref:Cystine-dense peptide n=1 Tax=synthetic construct TaxID=32630 RepID=UPI00202BBB28|nr:Chain D, Cystine-dense peptide [synthetic construct]